MRGVNRRGKGVLLKMADKQVSFNKTHHILAIPFPLQGHINPMVQFSKLLISRGFKVTLVTTASVCSMLMQEHQTKSSISIESVPDVSLDNNNDGTGELKKTESNANPDPDHLIDAFIRSYEVSISRSLASVVKKMETLGCPVKIIAFDAVMQWVLDLARQLRLKVAALSTQSAAVAALFYFSLKGTLKVPPDDEGPLVPSLPSLQQLGLNDLPSFIRHPSAYPSLLKLLLSQNRSLEKADWFLFNSFDELENEILKWMEKQWQVKSIGPLVPSKCYGLSLFRHADEDVSMKWLDSKDPGSVIYVSFGSLADLEEKQMVEIAEGLGNSNCHFLWVVRKSEERKLPNSNFNREGRGLVVDWCSQLEVLAHQAVGCFMTHCGWNSTLEALSLGVPMVAMPIWADQTTNAKFIADVWRVGVRVAENGSGLLVSREEVERCVKQVMEGEKRMELKQNALRWKKSANEALDKEGGSSEKNIKIFISELNAQCSM